MMGVEFCPITGCENTHDLTPFIPTRLEIVTAMGHTLIVQVFVCPNHAVQIATTEDPAVAPI